MLLTGLIYIIPRPFLSSPQSCFKASLSAKILVITSNFKKNENWYSWQIDLLWKYHWGELRNGLQLYIPVIKLKLVRVKFPPWRYNKAEISGISPSSEQTPLLQRRANCLKCELCYPSLLLTENYLFAVVLGTFRFLDEDNNEYEISLPFFGENT